MTQLNVKNSHEGDRKRFGYARVSTSDQDLTIQHEQLVAAGGSIIRSEKATGTKREGRE